MTSSNNFSYLGISSCFFILLQFKGCVYRIVFLVDQSLTSLLHFFSFVIYVIVKLSSLMLISVGNIGGCGGVLIKIYVCLLYMYIYITSSSYICEYPL